MVNSTAEFESVHIGRTDHRAVALDRQSRETWNCAFWAEELHFSIRYVGSVPEL